RAVVLLRQAGAAGRYACASRQPARRADWEDGRAGPRARRAAQAAAGRPLRAVQFPRRAAAARPAHLRLARSALHTLSAAGYLQLVSGASSAKKQRLAVGDKLRTSWSRQDSPGVQGWNKLRPLLVDGLCVVSERVADHVSRRALLTANC